MIGTLIISRAWAASNSSCSISWHSCSALRFSSSSFSCYTRLCSSFFSLASAAALGALLKEKILGTWSMSSGSASGLPVKWSTIVQNLQRNCLSICPMSLYCSCYKLRWGARHDWSNRYHKNVHCTEWARARRSVFDRPAGQITCWYHACMLQLIWVSKKLPSLTKESHSILASQSSCKTYR